MRRVEVADVTIASLLQYTVFLRVVTLLVRPAGIYLQRVFDGGRTWLDPVLVPVERAIHPLARIDPEAPMNWRAYAASFVVFTLLGAILGIDSPHPGNSSVLRR